MKLTRALVALPLVLLAACGGGGSSTPKADEGCPLAEAAFVAFDHSQEQARDKTATPADLSKDMGTIVDKMDGVATIATGALKGHAETAKVAAGRVRVGLSGDSSVDVATASADLRAAMLAASAICKP